MEDVAPIFIIKTDVKMISFVRDISSKKEIVLPGDASPVARSNIFARILLKI